MKKASITKKYGKMQTPYFLHIRRHDIKRHPAQGSMSSSHDINDMHQVP